MVEADTFGITVYRLPQSGLPGAIPACGTPTEPRPPWAVIPQTREGRRASHGRPPSSGPFRESVSRKSSGVAEETWHLQTLAPVASLLHTSARSAAGPCYPEASRSHWAAHQDDFGPPCRMWRVPQIRWLPQAANPTALQRPGCPSPRLPWGVPCTPAGRRLLAG